MKKLERVSFPLYPTSEQYNLMLKNCYNAKFAYNWGVSKVRDALEKRDPCPAAWTLSKEFNEFKHTPGYEWLVEDHISQRATKMALSRQLKVAISKFRNEHKRPPAYKTKREARMSYYAHEGTTKFQNNMVQLEGLGFVKCYNNFDYDNSVLSDPIIIFNGDMFELSVVVKYKKQIKPKYHYSEVDIHSQPIGIDVGLVHMAVTSNGDIFDMPNLSKLDKRIASIDRKIDRWRTKFRDSYYESLSCDMKTKYPEKKYIKSQNLLKLESKRRKLYHKHDCIRNDIRSKAVNSIVKQYPSAIVIEGMNFTANSWKIKGANSFNKRLKDVSPGDFLRKIQYKCDWLDIPLIIADSNYPSTKMCSCCGNTIANTLTRDRMFICSACGYKEDRDLNAAYNLRNLASTDIGKKKKKSKKIA